jgi:site-specific DNA-adenine methylase
MGTSFKRYYKKASIQKFKLNDFSFIQNWVIENEDFRKIMKRYNKPRVFFYLDPPYYFIQMEKPTDIHLVSRIIKI